jgi:hypothetical protein
MKEQGCLVPDGFIPEARNLLIGRPGPRNLPQNHLSHRKNRRRRRRHRGSRQNHPANGRRDNAGGLTGCAAMLAGPVRTTRQPCLTLAADRLLGHANAAFLARFRLARSSRPSVCRFSALANGPTGYPGDARRAGRRASWGSAATCCAVTVGRSNVPIEVIGISTRPRRPESFGYSGSADLRCLPVWQDGLGRITCIRILWRIDT